MASDASVLLGKEETKRRFLKNAIQKGIKSGWVTNFNPEAHLKSIKESYSKSLEKKIR